MYSIDPVPLPHDGPSDIALWRMDIDFTASLDAPAFASLIEDERTRARTFRRHEDALRFAEMTGVRPMIETYPIERTAEAYARMLSGKAEFRVVLTM